MLGETRIYLGGGNHGPICQAGSSLCAQSRFGWTYRYGIDFTVKTGEVHGGHGAAFLEYITRQGEEPPSHTHDTEDEMFYVLEGGVTFRCGEETFDPE